MVVVVIEVVEVTTEEVVEEVFTLEIIFHSVILIFLTLL